MSSAGLMMIGVSVNIALGSVFIVYDIIGLRTV